MSARVLVAAGAVAIAVAGCSSGGSTGTVAGTLPPLSASAAPTSTASASDSSSASASPSTDACHNASVTSDIRAALITADGRPGATEVSGTTFYGLCGDTAYAVTSFKPASGATSAQSVAFQDNGAYPKFFTQPAGGAWKEVGGASGPPGAPTCTAFTAAPAALRAIWGNCPISLPTASASASASASAPASGSAAGAIASCTAYYATKTFVILHAVDISSAGTATLTAEPVIVHCGGPDDMQFNGTGGSEQLVVAAGADIEVLPASNLTQLMKTDVTGLRASVQADKDGNTYQVQGPSTGLTSVTEQYRP